MRRLSSSNVASTDAARAQLWTHGKQECMTLRAASSKALTGPTSPSPTGPRRACTDAARARDMNTHTNMRININRNKNNNIYGYKE